MVRTRVVEFDGDARDAALDSIQDHALLVLFPFLTVDNQGELASAVEEHLDAHLVTELAVINGSLKDEEPTSPMVIRLKKRFEAAR